MSRRSSSNEADSHKCRHRASSWHQTPILAVAPKRTMTSPPPGSSVFEKRKSSAELMLQRLKQKFKPIRQTSSPICTGNLYSEFGTPGRHRGSVTAQAAVQAKRDERSRSLNAVYASSTVHPHHTIFRNVDTDDDYDTVANWKLIGQRCQHQPEDHNRFVGYEEDKELEDEENAMEVQKQIYRAKSEAKTVSVVNGCLYINYQYVCPLPSGCVV